jgi:hypothetical protein
MAYELPAKQMVPTATPMMKETVFRFCIRIASPLSNINLFGNLHPAWKIKNIGV